MKWRQNHRCDAIVQTQTINNSKRMEIKTKIKTLHIRNDSAEESMSSFSSSIESFYLLLFAPLPLFSNVVYSCARVSYNKLKRWTLFILYMYCQQWSYHCLHHKHCTHTGIWSFRCRRYGHTNKIQQFKSLAQIMFNILTLVKVWPPVNAQGHQT